jgi:hypothetical protein
MKKEPIVDLALFLCSDMTTLKLPGLVDPHVHLRDPGKVPTPTPVVISGEDKSDEKLYYSTLFIPSKLFR